MDTLFTLDPRLVSAFDKSERLKLRSIGPINMGTHDAPDYQHGVMYLTPEKVEGRGQLWVFVPLSDEFTGEDLIGLAPFLIEMAEDQLELLLTKR